MQNFLDRDEYAMWKRRCTKQRYIAARNPCYDEGMVTCLDYEVHCGPWNLRLVLETFTVPPIWHANISYFKRIGDETVYDKVTGLPMFETAKRALLLVKDWDHEEIDTARSLLGDLMGPLLVSQDIPVTEDQKVFAMHWIIKLEDVVKRVAKTN